ncbi:MAG: WG repeat-containing protein [Prevotella sp.]|nr:WG repeat-containing protein [Prevotellaceae bacterium]MDO5527564.1 WG repeat-containing protein [Prevotella sp.]
MNWGVIAVDGKMMVEPRYEEINISEDGMAELIIYKGKSIKLKLD